MVAANDVRVFRAVGRGGTIHAIGVLAIGIGVEGHGSLTSSTLGPRGFSAALAHPDAWLEPPVAQYPRRAGENLAVVGSPSPCPARFARSATRIDSASWTTSTSCARA